ncbi:sensor domain-containing protein [Actinomycetaceae bacterium L2_0104]
MTAQAPNNATLSPMTVPWSAHTEPWLESSPVFNREGRVRLAFFDAATWRAFLYLLLCLPLGIVGFAYGIVAVSLGAALAILIVGLVAGAGLVLGARFLAETNRIMTNNMLGTSIPGPAAPRRWAGVSEFVKFGLTDQAGWRAIAFFLLDFVVSLFASLISLIFWLLGLGMTTYGAWFHFLPRQQARDGSWHRGAQLWEDFFIDTPVRILLYAVVGILVFVFVWPALNNALAKIQALLAASLLGPTAASLTQERLESQRDRTAATSTDRMRSIERDLHDLTQAQLVAIAMQIGDVKDRLKSGESPDAIANSLDSVHSTSKEALADLRGLVRGIHPAALDAGLDTALQTLASRCAVPVSLSLAIDDDVAAPVEAIAYYCVAELLSNVTKHSRATGALVAMRTVGDRLLVQVRDNGIGGADRLVSVRERAGSVGGQVSIESPVGGPTLISIDLPRRLTAAP